MLAKDLLFDLDPPPQRERAAMDSRLPHLLPASPPTLPVKHLLSEQQPGYLRQAAPPYEPETEEVASEQLEAAHNFASGSTDNKFLQLLLHQMPQKLQRSLEQILLPPQYKRSGGNFSIKHKRSRSTTTNSPLSCPSLLSNLELEALDANWQQAAHNLCTPSDIWASQEQWRIQWLQNCSAQALSSQSCCWNMFKDFGLCHYVNYRYFEDCYRYSHSCLEQEQCGKFRILLQHEDTYPKRLLALPQAPRLLFWCGNLLAQEAEATAIIGSRQADSWGQYQAWQEALLLQKQLPVDWAFMIRSDLTSVSLELEVNAKQHWVISGLACGCDYAAHKGALDSAAPTLAVLPCGFDHIYPKNHKSLARQIVAEGGALVSEYVPQAVALKWRFIQRDRLQAALAQCILLVQSRLDGGSMHTVRAALALGKDVYVLEGDEPCWKLEGARTGQLAEKCNLQLSPRSFGTGEQRSKLMTANHALLRIKLARPWNQYRLPF